ncbi:MAG: hypothetical protein ABSG85_16835 [Spirochaetia bacterium]
MKLNVLRKDPKENPQVSIVIISAACCIPGVAAFDEQAKRVVDLAVAETGVEARVSMMPATSAYFGGAPREVIAKLMRDMQSGTLSVPAILINGKAVSYGVPEVDHIKSVLLDIAHVKATSK